jgi:hypothetical protein
LLGTIGGVKQTRVLLVERKDDIAVIYALERGKPVISLSPRIGLERSNGMKRARCKGNVPGDTVT